MLIANRATLVLPTTAHVILHKLEFRIETRQEVGIAHQVTRLREHIPEPDNHGSLVAEALMASDDNS